MKTKWYHIPAVRPSETEGSTECHSKTPAPKLRITFATPVALSKIPTGLSSSDLSQNSRVNGSEGLGAGTVMKSSEPSKEYPPPRISSVMFHVGGVEPNVLSAAYVL